MGGRRAQAVVGAVALAVLAALLFLFAPGRREVLPAGERTASERPAAGSGRQEPPPAAAPQPEATARDPAATPPPRADGTRPLKLPWGAGPDALGHDLGEERNAEGPPALAALPGGGFAVLDAVNGRLQRFRPDGTLD